MWLGAVWVRSDWDEAFHEVARLLDPAAEKATPLAALQKELQRSLLRDAKPISISVVDGTVIVTVPDLPPRGDT